VTKVQVTLFQIDNYGPWTVTPEPRREADLQALQSRLYADLSTFLGDRSGYVFFTRFDNMVAVTNGIGRAAHERLQQSIGNRYPVTISAAIAANPSPVEALSAATSRLQAAGSAQDGGRREILRGQPIADADRREGDVEIAHFDIVDATATFTDELNAYDAFIEVERTYAELMRLLRHSHEALSFFVGGDNVIAVTPALSAGAYEEITAHVRETVGVDLQVGVGRGPTANDAGMEAKHALEACRREDTRVERAAAGD